MMMIIIMMMMMYEDDYAVDGYDDDRNSKDDRTMASGCEGSIPDSLHHFLSGTLNDYPVS